MGQGERHGGGWRGWEVRRPICSREGWGDLRVREAPGGTNEEAEGRDELSIGKVNF